VLRILLLYQSYQVTDVKEDENDRKKLKDVPDKEAEASKVLEGV